MVVLFFTRDVRKDQESGVAGIDSSKILYYSSIPAIASLDCFAGDFAENEKLVWVGNPNAANTYISLATNIGKLTLDQGGAIADYAYVRFLSLVVSSRNYIEFSLRIRDFDQEFFLGLSDDFTLKPSAKTVNLGLYRPVHTGVHLYVGTSQGLFSNFLGREILDGDLITFKIYGAANLPSLGYCDVLVNGVKVTSFSYTFPAVSMYMGVSVYGSMDYEVAEHGKIAFDYMGYKYIP